MASVVEDQTAEENKGIACAAWRVDSLGHFPRLRKEGVLNFV